MVSLSCADVNPSPCPAPWRDNQWELTAFPSCAGNASPVEDSPWWARNLACNGSPAEQSP